MGSKSNDRDGAAGPGLVALVAPPVLLVHQLPETVVGVVARLDDLGNGVEAVPFHLYTDLGSSADVVQPPRCPIGAAEGTDHQVILAVTGVDEC